MRHTEHNAKAHRTTPRLAQTHTHTQDYANVPVSMIYENFQNVNPLEFNLNTSLFDLISCNFWLDIKLSDLFDLQRIFTLLIWSWLKRYSFEGRHISMENCSIVLQCFLVRKKTGSLNRIRLCHHTKSVSSFVTYYFLFKGDFLCRNWFPIYTFPSVRIYASQTSTNCENHNAFYIE